MRKIYILVVITTLWLVFQVSNSVEGQVITGGGSPITSTLKSHTGQRATGELGIAELADGTRINMSRFKLDGPFSYSADITPSQESLRFVNMKYKDGMPIGKYTHINVIRRVDRETIEMGSGTEFQTIRTLGGFVPLIGFPGSSVTLEPDTSIVFRGHELSPMGNQQVTFYVGLEDERLIISEIKGGRLKFSRKDPQENVVYGVLAQTEKGVLEEKSFPITRHDEELSAKAKNIRNNYLLLIKSFSEIKRLEEKIKYDIKQGSPDWYSNLVKFCAEWIQKGGPKVILEFGKRDSFFLPLPGEVKPIILFTKVVLTQKKEGTVEMSADCADCKIETALGGPPPPWQFGATHVIKGKIDGLGTHDYSFESDSEDPLIFRFAGHYFYVKGKGIITVKNGTLLIIGYDSGGPQSPTEAGKQPAPGASQKAGRKPITTQDINKRLTDLFTLAHKAQASEQRRQGIFMRGEMRIMLPEVWKTDDGQSVLVSPGTEVLWRDEEMKVTIGADWHTPFIAKSPGEGAPVIALRNGTVELRSGKLTVSEGTQAKLDGKEFIFRNGKWQEK